MISSFTIYLGLFLIIAAAATGFVFRLTTLPLAIRLTVPAVLIALACWTPAQVYSLLGYPVVADYASLPQKAELLAFVPHENDEPKTVDLLLAETGSKPRLYETALTEGMKKLLKSAAEQQEKGNRTEVVKKKTKKKPIGYVDTDGGEAPYELSDSAFHLPRKDSDE